MLIFCVAGGWRKVSIAPSKKFTNSFESRFVRIPIPFVRIRSKAEINFHNKNPGIFNVEKFTSKPVLQIAWRRPK